MKTWTIVGYMAVTALLLGIGQVVAIQHSLYWSVWWFDIVMHFLGGFWIALIALWFYKSYVGEESNTRTGYLVALVSVIVVGILWELFEIMMGLTMNQDGYALDTVLDLIMDTVGAIVATRFVFKRMTVVNTHNQKI